MATSRRIPSFPRRRESRIMTIMNDPLSQFLARAESLLHRLDAWLPPAAKDIDWKQVQAARWQRQFNHGVLLPVTEPQIVAWKSLRGIDEQKMELDRNRR